MPVPTARWWRFSAYRLVDGYIRPARGAKLTTYDPWSENLNARTKKRAPAYVVLLDLVKAFRLRATMEKGVEQSALTPESRDALLEWCSRNGLLGVLPHAAVRVTLAPRWERASQEGTGTIVRPVQQEYVRTSTGWSVVEARRALPLRRELMRLSNPRGELAPEFVSREWPRPSVLMQDSDGQFSEESLSKTWARYFPTVVASERETYRYPQPLSEDFWRLYAEPVEEFIWGVIDFRLALERVASVRSRKPKTQEIGRRFGKFNALLTSVNPAVEWGGSGLRQRWVATSLLGAYGLMALQDLTEQRQLLPCEVCRKLFLSGEWQARYCSATCRHTQQKRRYRERKQKGGQAKGS